MSGEPAAGVPDQALRSALEFAVGNAAAGAKLRPPVAFPVGLKRFLQRPKLARTALAEVRAAVDADDEFRRRLSSLATTELVDEVGMLWLSRPEGWSQAIAEILLQKKSDDETALRREVRLREAAQKAEARVRADVLGLKADLEREGAAKAAIVAETDRLRCELDVVRQRLREAQRAEHTNAQALARVEADLLEARRAQPEPSPPTAPSTIGTETVRNLIEGAVSSSTDVIRLLTGALAEITQVDEAHEPAAVRPSHQRRRAWRKPIRLPGGVLAGSAVGAEFLLRTTGAKTLVDGYNVAKLGWPLLDLEQQRQQCVAAAENLAKRWNMSMTIVFDGAAIDGAHTVTRRRVRIVYSPPGVSADDVLRAEVAAADVAKPVVVVTNDRAIITDVEAAGANGVPSDAFLALARR